MGAIEYSEKLLHREEYRGYVIRVLYTNFDMFGLVAVLPRHLKREERIARRRRAALTPDSDWFSQAAANFFPIHDYTRNAPVGVIGPYIKNGLEAAYYGPRRKEAWWNVYGLRFIKEEIDLTYGPLPFIPNYAI